MSLVCFCSRSFARDGCSDCKKRGEISQLSFNNDKGNHLFNEGRLGKRQVRNEKQVKMEEIGLVNNSACCEFIVKSGENAPCKSMRTLNATVCMYFEELIHFILLMALIKVAATGHY